ncbi:NF-kappa-B inhibitor zeta [Xylocopa sonorina]|uniref:NF-kappa-B inhibitor zeta n=1 Tax=Xylocopa sonorina TaxID=1818115 RepID=UPI00403AE0A9
MREIIEGVEKESSPQTVGDVEWDGLLRDEDYESSSINDLLKNVQDGRLQCAQPNAMWQYGLVGCPKTGERYFECLVENANGVGYRLDSRDSSPTRSSNISSVVPTEYPERTDVNLGENPIDPTRLADPRVTPTPSASHRPGEIFPNFILSSSSSVSNQSYGETTTSSNDSCQIGTTSLDWEERLGETEFLIQQMEREMEKHDAKEKPEWDEIYQSVNPFSMIENNTNDTQNLASSDAASATVQKNTDTYPLEMPTFKIPATVTSLEPNEKIRPTDRNIMPWSILNLPFKYSEKASKRLKEMLDPEEMKRAMAAILKRPPMELWMQDEDGYTTLMCLVSNPDELIRKIAYLVPLVERLSTDALTMRNNRGEDALYLAALNCFKFPFVTAYLAAVMLEKGIDLNQLSYRGDTLIHLLAAKGDTHKETLADLLALKTSGGHRLFDLSKVNRNGRTAIHVAVKSHEPFTKRITSLGIVSLLLKYGADPGTKETKTGNNALHLAICSSCDPALVKLLLKNAAPKLVNATNENLDTPLRMAASIPSKMETLERQAEVRQLLIAAGSDMNFQERIPFTLFSCTGGTLSEIDVGGETFYETS